MNFIKKLWIKGFSIQKTKITSKFAYEITLHVNYNYIVYNIICKIAANFEKHSSECNV